MTKKELVVKILEEMGAKTFLDKDVDNDEYVVFRYQMKNFSVNVSDEDEQYLALVMSNLYEIEEGEEQIALATCNKITRDVKLVNAYVDETFKQVSASYEFYYTDEESMKNNIEKSLDIFSIVRTIFRNKIKRLTE